MTAGRHPPREACPPPAATADAVAGQRRPRDECPRPPPSTGWCWFSARSAEEFAKSVAGALASSAAPTARTSTTGWRAAGAGVGARGPAPPRPPGRRGRAGPPIGASRRSSASPRRRGAERSSAPPLPLPRNQVLQPARGDELLVRPPPLVAPAPPTGRAGAQSRLVGVSGQRVAVMPYEVVLHRLGCACGWSVHNQPPSLPQRHEFGAGARPLTVPVIASATGLTPQPACRRCQSRRLCLIRSFSA